MPNIYASATDTTMIVNDKSTFALARDASVADMVAPDAAPMFGADRYDVAIRASKSSDNGFGIYRHFMAFDTSAITNIPESATLKIYGYQRGTSDVITIRFAAAATGDTSTNFSADDFDQVTNMKYAEHISSWNTSGYNSFTLNQDALNRIASLDTFKVALVNFTHDFSNSAPTSDVNLRSGMYFAGYSDIAFRPYISYTEGSVDVDDAIREYRAKQRRVRSRGGRTKGFSIGRVASPAGGGKVVSNGFKTDGY
jgi:hypothetical protein